MNDSPSTTNDRVHITGRPAADATGSHPGPGEAGAVAVGAVVVGAVVEIELEGAAVVEGVVDGTALMVDAGTVVGEAVA